MERAISGILIAGTSHVGKSTFAARLTKALGCSLISTDSLARHPGRPWPTVRPAVAEFYSSLSPETIHWFLKVLMKTYGLSFERKSRGTSMMGDNSSAKDQRCVQNIWRH